MHEAVNEKSCIRPGNQGAKPTHSVDHSIAPSYPCQCQRILPSLAHSPGWKRQEQRIISQIKSRMAMRSLARRHVTDS
jgi:hypothetical protein